jgi:hypothetical protein
MEEHKYNKENKKIREKNENNSNPLQEGAVHKETDFFEASQTTSTLENPLNNPRLS